MTQHQEKQIEVINKIEEQVEKGDIQFSTVPPVEDYRNDTRISLTSVHFLKLELLIDIEKIIKVLKEVEPSYYYFPHPDLHMTIKNIRVINDPPNFSHEDISKVANVFSQTIPNHPSFRVYFYRLMLFENNVALIGTTDSTFDKLMFELDTKLKEQGIPDDKKYVNDQYFFATVTLARFNGASEKFAQKVEELSKTISMAPYLVDSVSLIAGNAVLANRLTINTWNLQ